jgi:hypothetical protein
VFHKAIGDVRLGMTRGQVQATYGRGRTERWPRRDQHGACHYRRRGFEYDECGGAWLGGTRRVETILYVRKSRVYRVQLGEDDAVLYCF